MDDSEKYLINGLKQGNISAFEELHKRYYVFLCLVSEHIVRNPSDAEEIVSDVFVKLWNMREQIEITFSIKSYLFKAVHNTSLNHLEQNKHRDKLTDSLNDADQKLLLWDSDYPIGRLYQSEILEILDQGIEKLPDACREIFLLNRDREMKYSDIAIKLGISVNTVKTQMKIALARLRKTLKDYLPILLFFIRI